MFFSQCQPRSSCMSSRLGAINVLHSLFITTVLSLVVLYSRSCPPSRKPSTSHQTAVCRLCTGVELHTAALVRTVHYLPHRVCLPDSGSAPALSSGTGRSPRKLLALMPKKKIPRQRCQTRKDFARQTVCCFLILACRRPKCEVSDFPNFSAVA